MSYREYNDVITINNGLLDVYFRDFTSPRMEHALQHEFAMTGERTTFSQYVNNRLEKEEPPKKKRKSILTLFTKS